MSQLFAVPPPDQYVGTPVFRCKTAVVPSRSGQVEDEIVNNRSIGGSRMITGAPGQQPSVQFDGQHVGFLLACMISCPLKEMCSPMSLALKLSVVESPLTVSGRRFPAEPCVEHRWKQVATDHVSRTSWLQERRSDEPQCRHIFLIDFQFLNVSSCRMVAISSAVSDETGLLLNCLGGGSLARQLQFVVTAVNNAPCRAAAPFEDVRPQQQ